MVRGMAQPVLHRVRVGEKILYWVDNYPLFIRQNKQGWGVHAAPSRSECKTWLRSNHLQGQSFRTRQEALEMLLFALSNNPGPEPDHLPKATRSADGAYRTSSGWSFHPAPAGWDVYNPAGELQKKCRGSLWRALWLIDILDQEQEDNWPQQLRHDRTEQGIDDGVDRSPRQASRIINASRK